MILLDEPIRLKENGQINVILNMKRKEKLQPPPPLSEKHLILQEIESELNELVGLQDVKKMVAEVYAWIYINKKREELGLKTNQQMLHMMFKGNPGTGKTTVARIIAKLFKKMNVLSKGHLIEVERADLVGEYIGHTAQKTRDLIKKAFGGILFIGEAYSLGRGGEKDFGKEAIDTLVRHMENHKDEFILILAGYSKEMESFLQLNPGLHSRFPLIFQFPDYNIDELMEISQRMLIENEYALDEEAQLKLQSHLQLMKTKKPERFANGRYIRNTLEKAMRLQAMRLLHEPILHRHSLFVLKACDLRFSNTNE